MEVVLIDHDHFITQFLHTMTFMSHVSYELAAFYNIKSRDLISRGSGNS